jgi:hypothetical protein
MDAEAQSQRDIFYRTICGRIAQRRASTEAGYDELARWFDQRPASQDAWERFRDLLQDHILPGLPEGGRLVLVFDKVDRLPEPDGLDEASFTGGPRYPLRRSRFLERLRSLSQEAEAPWDQLRIVITAQTPPRFWWGAAGSAAVVASASELKGFDQAECEDLCARFELGWSREEVAALNRELGGHPALLVKACRRAKRTRSGLQALLSDVDIWQTWVLAAVDVIHQGQLQEVCRALRSADELSPMPLPDAAVPLLYANGVITQVRSRGHQLRYAPRSPLVRRMLEMI